MRLNSKVLFAICGVLAACAETPKDPTSPPGARRAVTSGMPVTGHKKGLGPPDDTFLDILARVPSFGGLYLDSLGTVTIVLTNVADLPIARIGVAAVLMGRCAWALQLWRA
jgi:hypothetical protein